MGEQDTENIIKEAARKIFHEKGFSATKTRDIAEAADINLALLNYYFRSKKKLYDIIMMETIHSFFSGLSVILDDEQTTIKEKVGLFVERYIDILTENPDMATFIINEVRQNPEEFAEKIGILDTVKNSIFIKQFQEAKINGIIPPINPIHFMMNISGLVVFPFIASPMISTITSVPNEKLINIIQERKRLIPLWIESMLSVN